MKENEITKIHEDIQRAINEKFGKRKYIATISFHTGDTPSSAASNTFIFGNVDYNRDGFNMVKAMLLGMQNAITNFVQQATGIQSKQQVKEEKNNLYQ